MLMCVPHGMRAHIWPCRTSTQLIKKFFHDNESERGRRGRGLWGLCYSILLQDGMNVLREQHLNTY